MRRQRRSTWVCTGSCANSYGWECSTAPNTFYPTAGCHRNRCSEFLGPFGLERPDSSASNSDKARMVFDFLASKLNTNTPHLHYAFDIPLRHVDATESLQRDLGSES